MDIQTQFNYKEYTEMPQGLSLCPVCNSTFTGEKIKQLLELPVDQQNMIAKYVTTAFEKYWDLFCKPPVFVFVKTSRRFVGRQVFQVYVGLETDEEETLWNLIHD